MAGSTPRPNPASRFVVPTLSTPARSPPYRITRSQLADGQWMRDHAAQLSAAHRPGGGGLDVVDDLGDLGPDA